MIESLKRRWATLRRSTEGGVLINAGWASAGTPVYIVFGVLQTAILARVLGPEGVGVLGLFVALRILFLGLFHVRSAEAVLVFANKAVADGDIESANGLIRYCYFADISTSLLAFLAMVVAAQLLPGLLNLPHEFVSLFNLYALIAVLGSSYWVSHALLRLADKFSLTFSITVIISSVKTVLLGLVLLLNGSLLAVVSVLLFVELLGSALALLFVYRALQPVGLKVSLGRIRIRPEVVRFQLAGHGRQIFKSLNRSLDMLVIGVLSLPVEVGYYRAGKQITDQMQVPAQAIRSSLFPAYSSLWFTRRYLELRKLASRLLFVIIIIGLIGSIVLWFAAEFIVLLVLGEEFLPATDVVRILLVAGFVLLIMSPVYSLPAAVGRAAAPTWAAGVALVVQIIVMFALVPSMGATGAAWSNVAYFLAWTAVLSPVIISIFRYTPEPISTVTGQSELLDS